MQAAPHTADKDLSTRRQRIVIVGGGFAGTTLLKQLICRLPQGYEVLMISEESYTTFNPMLPEVVGASIFPEQVVAPIRAMFSPSAHVRFIMGQVTSVNAQAKTLVCTSLHNDCEIAYEHLVLALGNRAMLNLIPGMAEHGLPLKTVGDAMHIRNIVLRRIARMELESDAQKLKSLGHFVVIGGGFSGAEVAGELIDCLRSVQHYYPRVNPADLSVTVLHDQDRMLLELPEYLGLAAAKSLRARGVTILLGANARAAEISDEHVKLTDGTVLLASTIITTIGTRPNALLAKLDLPLERGRLMAQSDFSVAGAPNLWTLGDCAHVINGFDGKPCPPTAQFAVRQAKALALNLVARIKGEPTQAFSHKSLGSMAAIGHKKGVASVFGFCVTGLPAWLIWRAYYLIQMPTLGRKVRIYLEWTWGMFFPADITHLRFTRSEDRDMQ